MRWYDADSGVVLREGSSRYEVQTRDMARTVIFEVTPVNKKGYRGTAERRKLPGAQR